MAAAAVAMSACGGEEPAPQSTVTVTQTHTPSAVSVVEQQPEPSDVKGRSHDAGTVVDVKEVAGQLVLQLDRWSVQGMDDAKLAKDGAPVLPNDGNRFFNQNERKTYAVPVAPGARLIVNECSAPQNDGGTPGLRSAPGDLEAFLSDPDVGKHVVLLTYSGGKLVQLDTDPVCG